MDQINTKYRRRNCICIESYMRKNMKMSIEKMYNFLYQVGEIIIWIFAIIICSMLFAFNLFYYTHIEYRINELVTIDRASILYVLGVPLLILGFMCISRALSRFEEKKLFCVFSIIYLVMSFYWMFNINTTLRADAAHINNAANLAAVGDFSFLELGQDIRNHPWQLGMITYERILGLFSKNVQLIFLMNYIGIIGINYYFWKLTDLIFKHNHFVNVNCILLLFAFLPQFFFGVFAYGLIPGFFCIVCGFYFQQKYFMEEKLRYAIGSICMALLAAILKGNYIIGVITMTILYLMNFFKKRQKCILILTLVMLVLTQIQESVIINFYEAESGYELNSGEPKLLYIAMGIMPENRGMAPGWYCGYNDYTFGYADFDPVKANEMAKESIKDSITHYVQNPGDAVDFFSKKIASVWCDPLFQSLWSGPLEEANQFTNTRILKSLYHGETLEKLVSKYMKIYILMLLVLIIIYLCYKKKYCYELAYAYIYMIGGFLLHIVWEGKSQYVYTYIFVLIPAGAYVISKVNQKIYIKLIEKNGK